MESKRNYAGSKKTNEPRTLGEILDGMFASNQPLARAARRRAAKAPLLPRWNRNTELCIDLKTVLHSDTYVRKGKTYHGLLRRDHDADIEEFRCRDAHFTFTEVEGPKLYKRNPHVFRGKYITVTRCPDGRLRLNFRPLPSGPGFQLERYALAVYHELLWALEGLVEED